MKRVIQSATFLLLLIFICSNVLAQQRSDYLSFRYLKIGEKFVRTIVDTRTDSPADIVELDSVDFGLGSSINLLSKNDVKIQARKFLIANKDALGVHPSDLTKPSVRTNGRLWYVSYGQKYRGLPVIGSSTRFVVSKDGKLNTFGIQRFQDISISENPGLSVAAAAQTARVSEGLGASSIMRNAQLSYLAEPEGDGFHYRLVWDFIVQDDGSGRDWYFRVDANNGDIIHGWMGIATSQQPDSGRMLTRAEDEIGSGPSRDRKPVSITSGKELVGAPDESAQTTYTVSGNVTLNYHIPAELFSTPMTRYTNQPFKQARVDLGGSSTWTDDDGDYSFTGVTSGSKTITFFMETEQATIDALYDSDKMEKSETFTVSGNTTKDYAWGWGDDGDEDQSVTAMGLNSVYHVNRMYKFWDETIAYDDIDDIGQIEVDLSLTKGDCGLASASTGTSSIWLGRQCALASDTALHEYNHIVMYYIYGHELMRINYGGGDPDYISGEAWAMSEAFPDYFANALTDSVTYNGPAHDADDPSFPDGEGAGGIRYTFNTFTMDNWGSLGGYHKRGQIISGSVWMIRRLYQMETVTDDLVMAALLREPQSFESFGKALWLEDTIQNSSANWEKIDYEFAYRKIAVHIPSGFSYTQNGDDLDFTWNDDSYYNTGYDLEHRLNGGAWSALEELGASATSATDEDVLCKAGDNYHEYRIRVYTADVEAYTAIDNFDPCYPERIASGGRRLENSFDTILELQPTETTLDEAYPNPFNPTTVIGYSLRQESHVTLRVFDILGREVRMLVNDLQSAGAHRVSFDAGSLPSGVYIYTLTTNETSITKSITLTK